MFARMLVLVLASSVALRMTDGLLFRADQFKDMTENCRKSNGKPIRFILNEDNPAMYVSVDPARPTLMAMQRAERVKLLNKFTLDDKGRLLLQVSLQSYLILHLAIGILIEKKHSLKTTGRSIEDYFSKILTDVPTWPRLIGEYGAS